VRAALQRTETRRERGAVQPRPAANQPSTAEVVGLPTAQRAAVGQLTCTSEPPGGDVRLTACVTQMKPAAATTRRRLRMKWPRACLSTADARRWQCLSRITGAWLSRVWGGRARALSKAPARAEAPACAHGMPDCVHVMQSASLHVVLLRQQISHNRHERKQYQCIFKYLGSDEKMW